MLGLSRRRSRATPRDPGVYYVRVLSVLALCVLSSALQQPQTALTLAVGAEEKEGVEEARVDVDEEEGDLEVVQPTDQWQTLRPGQAVPAGSHVRLNLQTGQREVRLGEEQTKYWNHKHREEGKEEGHSSFSAEELKQALKKMKEDVDPHRSNTDPQDQQDELLSQFRPLEELKKDMAELEMLVETDVQVMSRLLAQFNSTNSTTEQRLKILLELEYLVHQVDNAQSLCSMGGLQVILQTLNSSDHQLQENTAFVLGSAVASNPVVQVEAVENGALQKLLTLLATPRPISVKKKVLFALVSLLRHFPYAQSHFLSHGGLQVLSELFKSDGGGALRVRIVTLLYDMISEKELMSQAGLDAVPDSAHQERLRQYSRVSLTPQLLSGGWCSLVPELLHTDQHDWREKALRALLAMAPVCVDRYRSDTSLTSSVDALRAQYQQLVQTERILGEEDGYFGEILNLLDSLAMSLK